ncbi:hypothetical protein V8F20_012302 [Naviculisporaceae sp. PSN 640]
MTIIRIPHRLAFAHLKMILRSRMSLMLVIGGSSLGPLGWAVGAAPNCRFGKVSRGIPPSLHRAMCKSLLLGSTREGKGVPHPASGDLSSIARDCQVPITPDGRLNNLRPPLRKANYGDQGTESTNMNRMSTKLNITSRVMFALQSSPISPQNHPFIVHTTLVNHSLGFDWLVQS